jgi:hypothetical protein
MSILRQVDDAGADPAARDESSHEVTHGGVISRITSSVVVSGTLLGVATTLAGPLIQGSPLAWFAGGAGAVTGGLGMAWLSARILRRPRVRLPWKAAGMLGLPFGFYLTAVGILQLFVLPGILGGIPGLDFSLLRPVYGLALLLAIVLSLVVGVDMIRFVIRGVVVDDEGQEET